jgi:hypothetical protein
MNRASAVRRALRALAASCQASNVVRVMRMTSLSTALCITAWARCRACMHASVMVLHLCQ